MGMFIFIKKIVTRGYAVKCIITRQGICIMELGSIIPNLILSCDFVIIIIKNSTKFQFYFCIIDGIYIIQGE